MKFLKALFGLVALIKADTSMSAHAADYEADYLTSETKNFTVTPTSGTTKHKDETVMISYYVKKLTEKITGKSIYQLHGNCYINNMDLTGYANGADKRTNTC